MQELNIKQIQKAAKNSVFLKHGVFLGFDFFYNFVKTIYTIINVVSFGTIGLVISTIFFPYTVVRAERLMQRLKNEKQSSFLKLFLVYFKPLFCTKIMLINIISRLLVYFFCIFFIFPGILFAYKLTLLPFVIADNKNLSFPKTLKLNFSIIKNYSLSLIELFSPFIFYFFLSVLCLGITSFYFSNLYSNTKGFLYFELSKNYKHNKLATTSLL